MKDLLLLTLYICAAYAILGLIRNLF